jgi:hypothetical protein
MRAELTRNDYAKNQPRMVVMRPLEHSLAARYDALSRVLTMVGDT